MTLERLLPPVILSRRRLAKSGLRLPALVSCLTIPLTVLSGTGLVTRLGNLRCGVQGLGAVRQYMPDACLISTSFRQSVVVVSFFSQSVFSVSQSFCFNMDMDIEVEEFKEMEVEEEQGEVEEEEVTVVEVVVKTEVKKSKFRVR